MSLKLKIRSMFPANVAVTSPLTMTKTGLSYIFGFDMAQAPTGPAGPQGNPGVAGAGYGGTSATSLLIASLVTKSFTTQAALAYQVGNYVRAASSSAPANFMEGNVSGYSGTSLSINVTNIGGSGTFSDWVLSLSGAPGSVGVSSLNGKTGALVNYYAPQGRITLTSGSPVMATSVTAATTVYFTPTGGNIVPIYDGTNMVPTAFAEVSQLTTDTTKSPAAVANNSCYDMFVWNDAGTIRCTRGPAWTSTTTRSAGTALTPVNGIYLNSVSITNGPAASRGTYVGTICSNGTATIDFIFGNLAAGGGQGSLNVWNAYNQVQVKTTVADTTSTWAYSSSTIRQPRGQATMKVLFVSGLPTTFIDASYTDNVIVAAVNGAFADVGLALDSITFYDKKGEGSGVVTAGITHNLRVENTYPPQTGQHYISALENGDGTNSTTFVGTNSQALNVSLWV